MAASKPRSPRRASRWIKALCLIAVAVALYGVAAEETHASPSTDSTEVDIVQATNNIEKPTVSEFVPTEEWQDILPGQAIPPGLHVRLNLATGKREAKILGEDDAVETNAENPNVVKRDVAVDLNKGSGASVMVTTDIAGGVQDASVHSTHSHAHAVVEEESVAAQEQEESVTIPSQQKETPVADHTDEQVNDEAPPAHEPNWNHEKIYEVLQQLPEPPQVDGMDLHEAHAKLSTPEFRRRMVALWKKRQEELKEAIDTMQDDAKYLAKLLDQFKEAEKNGDTNGQTNVLEVLEWEVQDLDKTHVFNFIGGFNVIAEYLNSTNLPVRAHASWLIGTAVKNYKDGQDWAINAGVIPKLVGSLELPNPDAKDDASKVFEVKKKAVYALSSLVRFNPRGQRLLLSLDGPAKLSKLMTETHPMSVQLKAVLFAHDLLLEQPAQVVNQDTAALQYLHGAFRTPEWCEHTVKFLSTYVSKLERNQVVETLQAMDAQLASCQETFAAAGAKAAVESVHSAWMNDATLDEDEREDLVVVSSSLLSKL